MKFYKKVLSTTAVAALLLGATTLTSCGKKDSDPAMTDLISSVVLNNEGSKVSANFKVPSYVSNGKKNYKLEWHSNNTSYLNFEYVVDDPDTKEDESLEDATAKITQPTDEQKEVTFYAVLKNGSDTAQTENFRIRVQKLVTGEDRFKEFYDTASSKNTMDVAGYVQAKAGIATNSSGTVQCSLYLQDATGCGGYYAYCCTVTQEVYDAIKVGDYVKVTGQTSSVYNGVVEACYGDIEVDATNTNMDLANKVVDITAACDANEDLTYKQSQMVSLTGATVKSVTTKECTTTTGKYMSTMQTIATVVKGEKEFTVVLMEGTTPFAEAGTKTLFDTTKAAVKAGDIVTIKGLFVGTTSIAITDATNVTVTGHGEAPVEEAPTVVTTVAELNAGTVGKKYTFTGVVDELVSDKYGNMYIKDATGAKFYIYGLYDADDKRYDAMTTKPIVGDTITVTGALDEYNGTKQLKNAVVSNIVAGSGAGETPAPGTGTETTPGTDTPATVGEYDVVATLTASATSRQSFSKEQQIFTENGITITNDKASDIDIVDSSAHIRCYTASNLKFEYTSNFNVIVFTTTYADKNLPSTFTCDGATVVVDGTKCTIYLNSAASSFSIIGLPNQIRMTSVSVGNTK